MRYMIANVGIDAYDKQEIDEKLTLIKTASGAIASFNTDLASALKECEVSFTAYQASGTPTPSSPVPISGFSSATLTRTGKNLFDESQLLQATGWAKDANGYYYGTRANFTTAFGNGFTIQPKFKANTQYTFKLKGYCSTSVSFTYIRFYYTDGTYSNIPISGTTATDYTGTSTSGKTISKIAGTFGSDGTVITYLKDIMLVEGSTAEDYIPYSGTSVVIPFGDTYYGGEIDVVRGKFRVTHALVNLGSLTYARDVTEGKIDRYRTNELATLIKRGSGVTTLTLISDIFVTNENPVYNRDIDNVMCVLNSNGYFYISCSGYTSAANFKTAMNGHQLVYELATPIEIDLTPEQIATLVGDNNVFCDIPTSSVEVEYLTSQAKGVADVVEVLTKPIEVSGTLTAGSASITLSDEHITTDSTIDIYTSDGTEWNGVTVTTGVVVITFDAQASDIGVKVRVS